jgi:protein TonB
MKYILATFLSFSMLAVFAQEADTTMAEEAINFAVVDKFPVFPGCNPEAEKSEVFNCMQAGIIRVIQENFKYPEDAQKKKKEGKVYVNFVIEKNGKVSSVNVARGVYLSLDMEAVRVIKLLPKFDEPAYVKGKKVRMQYTVPINAKL